MLAERGDPVLGLIRNPEHADDLRADGVEPIVADLENIDARGAADHLSGTDAVVFAAGAGPGSGVERKDTVDREASVVLADASELLGVRRFIQISSIGANAPIPSDVGEVFGAYLTAKQTAEADLRVRQLDWTILRPGILTDDPPTGKVRLAESVERAEVTRADVAAVLLALLDEPKSVGHALTVVNGETAIPEAVRTALE